MSRAIDRSALLNERRQMRDEGKVVVFTNGCFDIIHPGHIRYLRRARSLGDALIVAINSDESVRRLKGPGRPILSEPERVEVLSALEMVDYVTVFDEETPRDLIASVLPDILVKGGDWRIEHIVGREEVEEAGGRVLSLDYEEGLSTSELIRRILNANAESTG